jgi:DNA polymerase type B, organellar and viral
VDGEGWGTDEIGRQCYKLLIAADDSGWFDYLYAETGRLDSETMLEWLWKLPDGFLTGYSFGYDISMILLDVPLPRLHLLRHREKRPMLESNPSRTQSYVQWRGWWLEWYPGKRFVIRRQNKVRTIWDAFPWYQSSYINAAGRSKLASQQEMEVIIAGKKKRGDDYEHTLQEELAYAKVECRVLSRIQRHLFQTCEDVGLPLTVFDGPGSVAAKAMNKYKVKQHKVDLPEEVTQAASQAYFGGRFEMTLHGRFEKLYEYDIISAYPAGMRNLPCLSHGEWVHNDQPQNVPTELYHVRWTVSPDDTGLWGPFPVRGKDGMPVWSFAGHAWVWKEEYLAAQWMGEMEITECWSFVPSCDHMPFTYIDEYYAQRAIWKADGDGREKVYKLVLNSGYGKVCQRVGSRPFHSWVWAGKITASARAQLLSAIRLNPDAVVMTATDALYSRAPLDLPVSHALGDWEAGSISNVLLVQPGFFRADEKTRARGIPDKYVDWSAFERIWDNVPALIESSETAMEHWGARISIPRFYGIKQGVHLDRPGLIGTWKDDDAFYAFYSRKRPLQSWNGTHIVSYPPDHPTAGWQLQAYDPAIWSGEREFEFVVEGPDADEWTYTD